MENQSMTIHRGLSELKIIDSKIERNINEIIPTGVKQKGKLINGHQDDESFKNLAQSKYDSVLDLIARKSRIKNAIVNANATTNVTVAGQKMTIADAINQKAAQRMKRLFVERLVSVHKQSISKLSLSNEEANRRLQSLLEQSFGKDNVKVTKDDMDAVAKPFIENNEFHLFDPLKIGEKIEILEKEMDDFDSEVDAVLSEINSITIISI